MMNKFLQRYADLRYAYTMSESIHDYVMEGHDDYRTYHDHVSQLDAALDRSGEAWNDHADLMGELESQLERIMNALQRVQQGDYTFAKFCAVVNAAAEIMLLKLEDGE